MMSENRISENFVEIIGFQFERVHTGMMAWLLDSKRSPLEPSCQANILRKLAPVLIEGKEFASVKAERERERIDLVITVTFKDAPAAHILIECKTDSDVSVPQLKKASESKTFKDNPHVVIALALGAGQFTIKHKAREIEDQGFKWLVLQDVLNIFANLPVQSTLYKQWIESLMAEQKRNEEIERVFDKNVEDLPGYRFWFPVYYAFYDRIRAELEKSLKHNWAIYTGHRNPVMNWQEGRLTIGAGDKVKLYWEFNWAQLCLKAHIDRCSPEYLTAMRAKITGLCKPFCYPVPAEKHRAGKGRGKKLVTIYKWNLDFKGRPTSQIAQDAQEIINKVHPHLERLPKEMEDEL